MKVKSESEVTQVCLTPSDPMDCSPPGPLSMGFSRQEHWSGVPLPSPYTYIHTHKYIRISQVVLVVKNPPTDAGDIRDVGLIPGSGRSSGGGHGSPLQYSCLENPMDREAQGSTVHGVAKSLTQL